MVDLLENLKSEDFKKRLNSVKNLKFIANVFGPEKTCQVLIPFLKEYKDDEREIMMELAV